MQRKFSAILFCLLCATAMWAQSASIAHSAGLDGTWKPVKAELGGQAVPEANLQNTKLTLKGADYVAEVNGVADRGTVKLLADTRPLALDVTGTEGPNKGKTFPAIYNLAGDTLIICYNLGGEARPRDFKTKAGTQLYLVTYQRAAE